MVGKKMLPCLKDFRVTKSSKTRVSVGALDN